MQLIGKSVEAWQSEKHYSKETNTSKNPVPRWEIFKSVDHVKYEGQARSCHYICCLCSFLVEFWSCCVTYENCYKSSGFFNLVWGEWTNLRNFKLTTRNLRDMLVKSTFNYQENLWNNGIGCSPCKRCSWCKNVKTTAVFKSRATGKEFDIFHSVTCKSSWIIYLAECTKCSIQCCGKLFSTTFIRSEKMHHAELNLGTSKSSK